MDNDIADDPNKMFAIFIPEKLNLDHTGVLLGFQRSKKLLDEFVITSAEVNETLHRNKLNADSTIATVCDGSVDFPSDVKTPLTYNLRTRQFYKKSGAFEYMLCEYDQDSVKNCTYYNAIKSFDVLRLLQQHLRLQMPCRTEKLFLHTMLMCFISRILSVFERIEKVISKSAILSHARATVETLQWFLEDDGELHFWSVRRIGIVISKLLDVAFAVIVVHITLNHRQSILSLAENVREIIIEMLRETLVYLMDAPIGLKLNFAFNRSLATFFYYHIALWRIFLLQIHPLLETTFNVLVPVSAIFGFTFQLAMLSDIIAVATFHLYCIYVYAARLIHLQLRGVWALWRLFIGRKYNPLRQRVDSYQYTHDQLCIGTLCFTILLFLLPTTAIYYIVFATFRLLIVCIEQLLSRLRFLITFLPLYITLQWLLENRSLAKDMTIKYNGQTPLPTRKRDGKLAWCHHVKLVPQFCSLWTTIHKSLPPLHIQHLFYGKPSQQQGRFHLLEAICTGTLI